MRIVHLAAILLVGFLFTLTACLDGEVLDIDEIASLGIVVHNHWTEDDVNDGKTVYIDLVNNRNECISGRVRIEPLSVRISITGLDESYQDDSVLLFDKTYQDAIYSEISYPQGQGILVLYGELEEYEQECCTAIWAEVTLPDGRVIRNNDPYDFDIQPAVP
ncbi:hypothetical protein ACFLW7_03630 [Chloroflexota bacterium]